MFKYFINFCGCQIDVLIVGMFIGIFLCWLQIVFFLIYLLWSFVDCICFYEDSILKSIVSLFVSCFDFVLICKV